MEVYYAILYLGFTEQKYTVTFYKDEEVLRKAEVSLGGYGVEIVAKGCVEVEDNFPVQYPKRSSNFQVKGILTKVREAQKTGKLDLQCLEGILLN